MPELCSPNTVLIMMFDQASKEDTKDGKSYKFNVNGCRTSFSLATELGTHHLSSLDSQAQIISESNREQNSYKSEFIFCQFKENPYLCNLKKTHKMNTGNNTTPNETASKGVKEKGAEISRRHSI